MVQSHVTCAWNGPCERVSLSVEHMSLGYAYSTRLPGPLLLQPSFLTSPQHWDATKQWSPRLPWVDLRKLAFASTQKAYAYRDPQIYCFGFFALQ
jgi:hypothetical protein